MTMASRLPIPSHPYYPLHLPLTKYSPNDLPVYIILASFGTLVALLLIGTLSLLNAVRPGMKAGEKATVFWFILCGFLHCFFEGYFVWNSCGGRQMGNKQDIFGQLWKEYALSDSRYLVADVLVLCMEGLTAMLWGPLSFLAASMIIRSSPLRHPIQLTVSVGHIYGLLLYYSTSLYERYVLDRSYSRPETLYFWGYYLGLNFLWMVVPVVLLRKSVRTIVNAFDALGKLDGALKKSRESGRPRRPERMTSKKTS